MTCGHFARDNRSQAARRHGGRRSLWAAPCCWSAWPWRRPRLPLPAPTKRRRTRFPLGGGCRRGAHPGRPHPATAKRRPAAGRQVPACARPRDQAGAVAHPPCLPGYGGCFGAGGIRPGDARPGRGGCAARCRLRCVGRGERGRSATHRARILRFTQPAARAPGGAAVPRLRFGRPPSRRAGERRCGAAGLSRGRRRRSMRSPTRCWATAPISTR